MADKREPLSNACERLRHRGPDSDGVWEDREAGIAFGHLRLAIQDLSPAGHQPMVSACGRYVLMLNGEIYNHPVLRQQLEASGEAPSWRGHSDTETILAAFAAWGVPATLARAVGMFAMALWDRDERTLTLIRDRMGEKPLYVGFAGENLVFASELSALQAMPGLDTTLDRRALASMLRHNYIAAPFSIYRDIAKLEPASMMNIGEPDCRQRRLPAATRYWRLDQAGDEQAYASGDAAVDALEAVLGEAVSDQMISDVPLGAFLSGGIDSSLIVALMQRASAQPVRSFSIGFEDPAFNEAQHAREVARHLGTDHTEMTVTAQDALDVVPNLAHIYDEPFADASQIPTILVTRMARQHVTVALSGDGGDELFGGYARYFRAARWWDQRVAVPQWLHAPVAGAAAGAARMLPSPRLRNRAERLAKVFGSRHAGEFYRPFVSYWDAPERVLIGGAPDYESHFDVPMQGDFLHRMTQLDALTYLPDDILVKVDRAAMACSLETRVPMLDHRVVEFSQRLGRHYKVRGREGKWLLRQLLYRHVPQALVDRPKKGFSVPLGAWLRGPLRDWAAELLDPARLRNEGVFHPEPILQKWAEHQAGHRDWSPHLWSILMIQAWLQHTGLNSAAKLS